MVMIFMNALNFVNTLKQLNFYTLKDKIKISSQK